MLTTLAIANYRSLRNIVIPLQPLNIISGPNGSGKSSLYRALRLLADTAQGRVVSSIAREGGLPSTLWAGPEELSRSMRRGDQPIQGTRRTQPMNLRLGFASSDYGYVIDLGLPAAGSSAFQLDPQIKRECIWNGPLLRPSATLVDRNGPVVRIRREDGDWDLVTDRLSAFDSMMTHVSDPRNAPELLALRELIRDWRFYDYFRTDADAPVRSPQVGTWTPVLSNEGSDLASAVETIRALGSGGGLDEAVEDAFPGSRLFSDDVAGRLALTMEQRGLLRPLGIAELSEGTLRYLLWIAALLTPRSPAMMVLNEPETSLHPDLLPALARLIAKASQRTQIVIVTHARPLLAALEVSEGCRSIILEKAFGETKVAGAHDLFAPAWRWPLR